MSICERMFETINQKQGKSAAGLCKVLGIKTNVTTGWKQRNTDPPAKYLVTIAEYLGVSVMYLLTGEDAEMDQRREQTLTDDENRLLAKYRCLDEDGKDAVRGVLLNEQRRVESEKGMEQSAS